MVKEVISLNGVLGLPSHSLFVWVFLFYFSRFPVENFFIFRTDCKNLVFISCFYFTSRILKVLMQVKTTFVTLHGVMSLLGNLWAKGRYVCFCHKFWVNMLCGVVEFYSFQKLECGFFNEKKWL